MHYLIFDTQPYHSLQHYNILRSSVINCTSHLAWLHTYPVPAILATITRPPALSLTSSSIQRSPEDSLSQISLALESTHCAVQYSRAA